MASLQFPTSPIKPNVLQPTLTSSMLNTTSKAFSANVALLKPVQMVAAKVMSADSTDGDENKNATAGKRKRGKQSKGGPKEMDILQGIPFIKHHHSVKKPQTPSVSRRNARERNRVKQVNNGFCTLRQHIPHLKNKTSKVDTLRAAVEYIQTLRQLLGEDISQDDLMTGPILISDAQENAESKNLDFDDSRTSGASSSPQRSMSAQSGEINPLVYQLPPVNLSDFNLEASRGSTPDESHFQDLGSHSSPSPRSPTLSTLQPTDPNFWWQPQGTMEEEDKPGSTSLI